MNGTKVPRRRCDRCQRRRRIAARWEDTGKVLCGECSLIDGVALAYSIRSATVTLNTSINPSTVGAETD